MLGYFFKLPYKFEHYYCGLQCHHVAPRGYCNISPLILVPADRTQSDATPWRTSVCNTSQN